ncbi:hypothetical protein BTVI_64526 [Pitangus sulphuratus]|nr:hypothetical protein BTVI_64526 [Pitangus sulphuratus]
MTTEAVSPRASYTPAGPVSGSHYPALMDCAELSPPEGPHPSLPSTHPHLAFGLVKFLPINHSPKLQSVYIPLQGLLSLRRVYSNSQFGIIRKLANGAFNCCIHIIDKYVEQDCTPRNITGYQSDVTPFTAAI